MQFHAWDKYTRPLYNMLLRIFYLIVIIASSGGCAKINLYEKSVHIPRQEWSYSNKPSFAFNVMDTSARYNVYVVVRHTDAYKYNNLWVSLGSQAPGDSMLFQNINLQLANDKTGWEGIGMDDIYEVRKNITPGPVPFRKAGTYQFRVGQVMRENPLKHILDIGIRVEKL